MIGAEKARRMERLQRADLPSAFDRLPDGDKRRHVRVPGTERARDDRANVRHRLRLRRDVAGVPVILVARVQDEAEVRGREAADDRALVHDARDVLEPLRELDVVHVGVDARKRAQHVLDRHARGKRRIALRVERLRAGHAARHPEHDDRVGGGSGTRAGLRGPVRRRAAASVRSQPATPASRRPSRRQTPPAHLRVDQALLAAQTIQFVLPGEPVVLEVFVIRAHVAPSDGDPGLVDVQHFDTCLECLKYKHSDP